ncbi:MAG: hypothetical protein IJ455_00535 [Agathobacter sp.]|nr:hypothetical protein [Agathobacter sp.]
MKKRNILFILLLAMSMLITACGSSNQTVEGKWVGTLDVTKQFEDGIKTAHPDLAKYIEFEELEFVMDISFVDGQMAIDVQQESVDTFNANFAEGMKAIAEGYWEDGLAKYDMTLEEDIAESGMTEEEYLNNIYKQTGIDKMIEGMTDITNGTLDRLSKMHGTYTTPVDNELRLYYTDDEFESMEYSFKGKKLNITIQGDKFTLLIECEKAK